MQHKKLRWLPVLPCLSCWLEPASAVPLTFELRTPQDAVAVQFDVVSPVAGLRMTTPSLEGLDTHVVDGQRQTDGSHRFVVFSSSNAPLSGSGLMDVTLSTPAPLISGGFLTVGNVLAATAAGVATTQQPALNALPVILDAWPPASFTALPQGSPASWRMETFDPDGTVAAVTFFWNDAAQSADSAAPFTGVLPTGTAGDFDTAFEISDSGGGRIRLEGGAPLRIFPAAAAATWEGFQQVFLPAGGGAGGDTHGLGFPNLMAYALGLNPTVPDRALYPSWTIETTGSQRQAVYRADLVDNNGFTPAFEVSSSLNAGTWSAAAASTVRSLPLAGGRTRYELRVPLTPSTPVLFARLRLTKS